MAVKPLTKEKLEKELARLEAMKEYEYLYEACPYICGIDEAGRGPLAGPVVAAAVILPKDCQILYLNDSKKLSEKKRELLFDEITKKAISYGIGIVGPGRIDEINILQATYEAMRQAVQKLGVTPDILLNDAVIIPGIDLMQIPIVKGDEYDTLYPNYDFAKHKGYGTSAHIQALREYGACPIHRKTFLKNFHLEDKSETKDSE